MIKTEATRKVITAGEQLQPPQDVVAALRRHDSELELIWNWDSKRWEIYRLKQKAVTPTDDILCWQMSVPKAGSDVSVSIVDWLRKYDTTDGGMKSKEELEKEWKSFCRWLFLTQIPNKEQKQRDEIAYRGRCFVADFATEKTYCSLSIPKMVGQHKKTGKKIYAVPRGYRRQRIARAKK